MIVRQDTLFLYRFDKPVDRQYGPRRFDWIAAMYGERPECMCAPADSAGIKPVAPWRPVEAWVDEVQPAPATARQLKRLAKLGHTKLAADLTSDEAIALINSAEDELPPTPNQLAKAGSLKCEVPQSATRGYLADVIDRAERHVEVVNLRRHGQTISEGASWDEIEMARVAAEERAEGAKIARRLAGKGVVCPPNLDLSQLEELESARSDLDHLIHDVNQQIGYRFVPQPDLTHSTIQQLISALDELPFAYITLEGLIEHLADNGQLPRIKRRALKSGIPALLDRLLNGSWKGDVENARWFVNLVSNNINDDDHSSARA